MFHDGQGAKQDYTAALTWFRKAAEQGAVIAEFSLGLMYYDGLGVKQDYIEALKWYRKAADRGNAQALYNLGVMYFNGQGVQKNHVQAYMLLDVAAAHYPPSDRKDRDDAVKARDLVASEMNPAQIAEARKLAREWKPK